MMKNKERINTITERLQNQFHPTHLKILDDSHLHVGHTGAKSGKGHFTIEITSHSFEGKTRLEQHRMIYSALEDLFETDIHAIRIRAQS